MKAAKAKTRHLYIIALVILTQYTVLGALMGTTATSSSQPATVTTTTTKPSLTFTQPTFNFDFGSMRDRSTAQNAMTQARSNWGNFFT